MMTEIPAHLNMSSIGFVKGGDFKDSNAKEKF